LVLTWQGEAEAAQGRRGGVPCFGVGGGRKAGWAVWAKRPSTPVGRLGQLGWKLKEVPFGIKIRFLNLQRLWKIVQGDLE
jgi:hypothetical protein